jgi:hypothetical protein
MKKSIPCLFILFYTLFPAMAAMAQHDFRPGYIVTYNNDTLHGQIDYAPMKINSIMCNFRPDSTSPVKIYSAKDIKGYAFISGKHCVAKNISINDKPVLYFLEYIVKGEVNLYYLKISRFEYYFLERAGIMYELSNDNIPYMEGRITYTKESEEYKRVLLSVFKDTPDIAGEIQHTYFTRKSLTDLMITYHELINKPKGYKIYEAENKNNRRKKSGQ